MSFAAPLWLLGLLPWAVVVLYVLQGRHPRRDVPFLGLWKMPPGAPRERRKVSAPPAAVALALLAALSAILAAAAPGIMAAGGQGAAPITVIVDRGLTLSARGGGGEPRYQVLAHQVSAAMEEKFGKRAPIELLVVPARGSETSADQGEPTDALHVAALLDATAPTAVDVSEAVRQLARRRLSEAAGPVVVISDAVPQITDPRLVWVAPASALRNACIALLSARQTPRPQVMVRVRNDSPRASAALELTSAGQTVRKTIDLPLTGAEQDYFIDFARLGDTVSARLEVEDELPADDQAWLVRSASWPAVEADQPVGDLQRLIDLYTAERPAGAASQHVRVTRTDRAIAPDTPIAVAAAGAGEVMPLRPDRVGAHPIVDAVSTWPALELPAVGPVLPPGGNWEPILWAGKRVLVAVREAPARQVWVGIDVSGWSARPEYVVFWAAVFDWVGKGGETFESHPLPAGPEWRPLDPPNTEPNATPPALRASEAAYWPGVFARADGARQAFSAATFKPANIAYDPKQSWRQAINGQKSAIGGRLDLSAAFAVSASLFIAAAAVCWPYRQTGSASRLGASEE